MKRKEKLVSKIAVTARVFSPLKVKNKKPLVSITLVFHPRFNVYNKYSGRATRYNWDF